jgi:hypothetical protein
MGAGQTIFCGSGLAVAQEWEQFHQQPVTSVNMHIEPELVMNFCGTLTKNEAKKGFQPYPSILLPQKYLNPDYN